MSKSKKICIIIGAIILVVGAIILYLLYFPVWDNTKTRNVVRNNTTQFANVWGNYQDESSSQRLEDLKKYFSKELVKQYDEDFQTLRNMSKRFGPSVSSQFVATSATITGYKSGVYSLEIMGDRTFPELNKTETINLETEIRKILGQWRIIGFEVK